MKGVRGVDRAGSEAVFSATGRRATCAVLPYREANLVEFYRQVEYEENNLLDPPLHQACANLQQEFRFVG